MIFITLIMLLTLNDYITKYIYLLLKNGGRDNFIRKIINCMCKIFFEDFCFSLFLNILLLLSKYYVSNLQKRNHIIFPIRMFFFLWTQSAILKILFFCINTEIYRKTSIWSTNQRVICLGLPYFPFQFGFSNLQKN